MRTRASERQDSAAEVRAAIAPAMERLQNVETALRGTKDQISRVDAAVGGDPGEVRVARGAGVGGGLVAVRGQFRAAGVDPTLLARLEEAVERLDRDEASARLVKFVEERLVGRAAGGDRADRRGAAGAGGVRGVGGDDRLVVLRRGRRGEGPHRLAVVRGAVADDVARRGVDRDGAPGWVRWPIASVGWTRASTARRARVGHR